MHGNVSEWCADIYINPYPERDIIDPRGPSLSAGSRVIRGGAWGDHPLNIRSAYRNCNGVDGANNGVGLRCVMIVSELKVP
jgi:formylglycine-generating enzyme required for sulfatase activity